MTVVASMSDEDARALRRIVGPEHRIISTRNVAEARDAIRKYCPQIVICDSDASRAESWRDLLSMPECESFALIVASRHADERLWAEVLNFGGHDVLVTPFRQQELEWSISSALRRAGSK